MCMDERSVAEDYYVQIVKVFRKHVQLPIKKAVRELSSLGEGTSQTILQYSNIAQSLKDKMAIFFHKKISFVPQFPKMIWMQRNSIKYKSLS